MIGAEQKSGLIEALKKRDSGSDQEQADSKETGSDVAASDVMAAFKAGDASAFKDALSDLIRMIKD